MVQLPDDAPAPRLCIIEKTSVNQEYGYNLHAEKGRGQFVGMVDKNSPAELGGLRMGDRIFAVNGHSIIGESHKKVVERIKENALRCEMLVISDEGAKWYMEHGIQITPQLPNIQRMYAQASSRRSSHTNNTSSPTAGWYAPTSNKNSDPVFIAPPPPPQDDLNMNKPKPRLCRLEKSSPSDEFGFNLHAEKGRGHFIGTVDQDGIGDRSGLRIGQRIVGVNGLLIFPNTPHKEVVALIKKSQLSTTLLVASEEVDKWYKEHSVMYSFDYAEDGVAQLSPHSIHISDDEELHEQVSLKQKESEHVEHLQHDLENIELEEVHETSPSVVHTHSNFQPANQYDSIPSQDKQASANNDDIMNAVFSVLPSAPNILLQSEEIPQSEIQFVHSPSVTESDKHSLYCESAIDVHHYDPSYVAQPTQQERSQISPVSNGSSLNGYHSSSNNTSPSAEKFDIFGLSAKEARERLRQNKKNHYKGFDMSLEEKYRLVSNM